MKSLILIFLLILCPILAWSLPSRPAGNGFTTCFTNSELEAFEAAVQAETEQTVKEAVGAAVLPYVAAVEKKDRQIKGLRTTLVVTVSISVVCLGGWVLMSALK